jgi:hypothetical protein
MRRRMMFGLGLWTAPLAALAVSSLLVATGGAAFGAPRSTTPRPKAAQVPAHFAKPPKQPPAYAATKVTWPTAKTGTLSLAAPGTRATASGLPVWARAVAGAEPASLRVKVLGQDAAQAAGIPGVLLEVSGDQPGRTQVGVDYSGFAQAYGGNYGPRLGLASYPACVLTTPSAPQCRVATPLVSTNDSRTGNVSSTVALPAASRTLVLAATTATTPGANGGTGGSYAATTLSASGTWSADGDNTGDFAYTYPIEAPSAPSPLAPTLDLSYSSGATDAENATDQPQSSWVGEGWTTPDSFIEQSFQNCSESPEGTKAPSTTYDLCYDGAIYNLAIHGTSTALVWDTTKKAFRTEQADGSVVKHFCTLPANQTSFADPTCVAGTSNGTSTQFKDWWQVTDRDGTSYSFGMNQLPGWASGKTATGSVATEPIYSAHSGDPCYSSSGFSASVCTMPYRWGLDYTTDVHGNAMSYYYHDDTNFYGAFNGASMKQYARDQYLDHIDYGFTDGNAYGTVPDTVTFHNGPRCVSGTCTPLNATTKANWPDVPYDQVCASGATCTGHAPSFFSTVRLTSIETRQLGTTVDTYALTQSMPQTGDGTSPTLWLNQIQRTAGVPGSKTAIVMPAEVFTPSVQMDSRVSSDGLPAFKKYRLQTVTTETGSQITVAYALPYPCSASAKPTASANTSSCYPVSWMPDGFTEPITDWFNKYAVSRVTQSDPTGGAPMTTTSYAYPGRPAWHFDDNEIVKAKYRTYGQFRGYGDIVKYLGDDQTPKSKTETTYYRGMSKDNNGTVVNVQDSQGGLHEDADQLAGNELESTAYLGANPDQSTITSYWVSDAAATRTRTGLPALTSNWVAPVAAVTRQALTSTGSTTWRNTEIDTGYDATTTDANFGLPTHVYTHTNPVDAAYSTCKTTTYAAAGSRNLVGLEAEVTRRAASTR